jgi:hypothetical protein
MFPTVNTVLAIYGAALSSVLALIKVSEFLRDKQRSKVQLKPAIELPPHQEWGIPLLSVGNSTPNGCQVYEVELVMERTVKDKENARRMSHYCPIPGTGVIPGFGELKVDLRNALESVVNGLWRGTKNTYYPDVRMWAVVRFVANSRRGFALSDVYNASWVGSPEKPPEGIRWLKVASNETPPLPPSGR